MTEVVHASDLSDREKRLLFWASFLSLMAAGVGFSFRVAMGGEYSAEFQLTNHEVGMIFGASLWPIAITMIGFSLVVDRTGYKMPMYVAFLLQALSGIGTFFAGSYGALYGFAICAGLGHGIVEAVINPICAAVYPKEKTKWLTLLHAAWPAGLVAGTLAIIWSDGIVGGPEGGSALEMGMAWKYHALWILFPAVAYVLMYGPCKFPVDERVQAGVPYKEMLQQVGFLSAFLAFFLVTYEIGNQGQQLEYWQTGENWFNVSLLIGLGLGAAFGLWVKALGRPLYFLMCLLMIPVATAELGTDQWIKNLMNPVLADREINAAYALVFSAFIMLIFRVFAGGVLKIFNPPALLCVSGVFSAIGLFWLSSATGAAIFIAFTLYAIGQTYYWPCVLGFVSERYPRGGALTLNTVSAIGLLSAGIIGGQLLGVAFDKSIHEQVVVSAPELTTAASADKSFLGMSHEAIMPKEKDEFIAAITDDVERGRITEVYADASEQAGRDVLLYAVRFPLILLIVFGAIALWFRSKGGYKPVELE
ncbi:MAG: MFS family permease [Planctomycetota bacterium]|jgi:MFS family permease